MKKHTLKQIHKIKHWAVTYDFRYFFIGINSFLIMTHGFLDESTDEHKSEIKFSCFLGNEGNDPLLSKEKSPLFSNELECYKYAIERYNDILGNSLKNST